jgi:uncharacterized repeat protein (TIGR01451 family)
MKNTILKGGYMRIILCVCLAVLIAGLCGCCKHEKKESAMMEPSGGCPRVESPEGMNTQTGFFPGQSANMIRLERRMPAQIRAGQPFDYDLIVTNLTDTTLNDVTVMENLGDNFRFKTAAPEGNLQGRQLVWKLNDLGPKATQKITVTGMVEESGKLAQCADVRYRCPTCSTVDVVAPALALTKTVPSDILLCDKIPIKYTVTNSGTGVVRNVVITDKLPEGLLTLDGGNLVALDACPLGPGQSQEFSVMLHAEKPGQYSSTAVVKADGDLSAESDGGKIMVHEPVLAVAEKGQESGYIGRPIKYAITVTNTGDAPAAQTVLQQQLPADARFISATEGGNFSGGTVRWDLGTISPQTSRTVELAYSSDTAGLIKTSTQAIAQCAMTATSSAETQISGVPGILLEMWDVTDPILVGETETYEIRVTNQGSATDTDIKLIGHLEDTMQYVSSSGATAGTLQGNEIVFETLPSLAPKAVATWSIKVRPLAPANARFRVDMTSAQLGSTPAVKVEPTRFYH